MDKLVVSEILYLFDERLNFFRNDLTEVGVFLEWSIRTVAY